MGLVSGCAGVFAVALVTGGEFEEPIATALPLLEVAPGVKIDSLLLLFSPVDVMTVALLVLPAPASLRIELELAVAWLNGSGSDIKITDDSKPFF